MRIIRFLVGILLLPCCWMATTLIIDLVEMVQPESTHAIPASGWALGGGFVLWLILFFAFPKPTRTYVLAHELSHALWALAMQAKVSKMRISKDSGSVTLSKTNFLIMLAPYFFPLYTVMVIAGFYATSIFCSVERFELYWLGLVGFTWGFHFTFTISTLMQKQTDIKECGHLFSYSIIYIFNIIGIGLWVVMVSTVTFEDMMTVSGENIALVAERLQEYVMLIIREIRQ